MKKLTLLILLNISFLFFGTIPNNTNKQNSEYKFQRSELILSKIVAEVNEAEKNVPEIKHEARKASEVSISKTKNIKKKQSPKANNKSVSKFENYKKHGREKKLDIGEITIEQFIDTAKNYLGTPYSFGGTSKKSVDCSGLFYASFSDLNVTVPRDAQGLSRYGTVINEIDDLKRGDLVFFVKTYNTSKFITHVGIYLGDYNFLHATRSAGVATANIKSKYYSKHFIFGTRIFPKNQF